MDENTALFIILVLAILAPTAIILTWIKHRSAAKAAAAAELQPQREIELLSSENAGLKGQIGRLEERLAVLERIATDPAERTARAIEQLR